MTIVRPVESDADIDTYLEVRNRVHPETPLPREVVLDDRQDPEHLDLIAERDGIPVGAASASKFGGAPDGLRSSPRRARRTATSAPRTISATRRCAA